MTEAQYAAMVEQTATALRNLGHDIKIENFERRVSMRCVNCNGAAHVFRSHHKAMADVKASNTCGKKQFSLFANFMK